LGLLSFSSFFFPLRKRSVSPLFPSLLYTNLVAIKSLRFVSEADCVDETDADSSRRLSAARMTLAKHSVIYLSDQISQHVVRKSTPNLGFGSIAGYCLYIVLVCCSAAKRSLPIPGMRA
jgi:hypothetical protein